MTTFFESFIGYFEAKYNSPYFILTYLFLFLCIWQNC